MSLVRLSATTQTPRWVCRAVDHQTKALIIGLARTDIATNGGTDKDAMARTPSSALPWEERVCVMATGGPATVRAAVSWTPGLGYNRAMSDLQNAIDDRIEAITTLRHDIHSWPEPGFEEVETHKRILAELTALGLSPRPCAETGVICDIGAGERTIALRADIDCLRMTEANPDLPWRSKRDGCAHMCGHDGHTSVLIGAAQLLAKAQDRLNGRVRLIFQPAEEGPGGAAQMIEEGALDGVDEIYGMHNWPQAPFGTLRTIAGPCMAHVASFRATITGKGGHASQPQECVDPIVAASAIVVGLQTVVSRSVHYQDSAVISVTTMHGGEVFNVIPDQVQLGGTIRVLRDEVWDVVERRIREVVEGTAASHGARGEVRFERMYPALVNTPDETAHVERIGGEIFGGENVGTDELPMLGAEDFAYFLQHRPGCFFFLGTAQEGRSNAPCHATNFDFNDALIDPAMRLWIRLVEDRLGTSLYD